MPNILTGLELDFAIKLGLCLVLGLVIGVERELRNKPAGISTHCFVMAGACLFTSSRSLPIPTVPPASQLRSSRASASSAPA